MFNSLTRVKLKVKNKHNQIYKFCFLFSGKSFSRFFSCRFCSAQNRRLATPISFQHSISGCLRYTLTNKRGSECMYGYTHTHPRTRCKQVFESTFREKSAHLIFFANAISSDFLRFWHRIHYQRIWPTRLLVTFLHKNPEMCAKTTTDSVEMATDCLGGFSVVCLQTKKRLCGRLCVGVCVCVRMTLKFWGGCVWINANRVGRLLFFWRKLSRPTVHLTTQELPDKADYIVYNIYWLYTGVCSLGLWTRQMCVSDREFHSLIFRLFCRCKSLPSGQEQSFKNWNHG